MNNDEELLRELLKPAAHVWTAGGHGGQNPGRQPHPGHGGRAHHAASCQLCGQLSALGEQQLPAVVADVPAHATVLQKFT